MFINTDPATADTEGIATGKVAAETGHTTYCAWHAVMAVSENWDTSQIEDPTAVWCQGDPTVGDLVEPARDLISGYCHCD